MTEAKDLGEVVVLMAAVGFVVVFFWMFYWVVTQYGWLYLGGGLFVVGVRFLTASIYPEEI